MPPRLAGSPPKKFASGVRVAPPEVTRSLPLNTVTRGPPPLARGDDEVGPPVSGDVARRDEDAAGEARLERGDGEQLVLRLPVEDADQRGRPRPGPDDEVRHAVGVEVGGGGPHPAGER